MKKLIVLLLFLPCVMLGQDTTKGGLPLIKGRTYIPRMANDTVFIGTMNAKTQISANADSAASAHNRITQLGSVSVAEFGTVANGVANDSLPFANAIASVVSGGTLVVPAGVYSSGQVVINKPMTVVAAKGAVLKAKDNLNTTLLLITSDSVTVKDLILDGNRANQSPTPGSGSYDVEQFTHAIRILPPRREIKLENVIVRNAYNNGLYAHGLQGTTPDSTIRGLTVTGSRFYDNGDDCIFIRATWDVQIVGANRFESWGQRDTNSDAIRVWEGTHNFVVQNNLFKPTVSRFFGIEMTVPNAGDSIRGVNISTNTFDGLYTGISGHFGYGYVMTGNEFYGGIGNWRSGFELVGEQGTVTGNTIRNGSIAASGSKNMNISSNTISTDLTSGFGIAFGVEPASPDSSYSVNGNVIDISRATNAVGIYAGTYGSTGVVRDIDLIGNQIRGNSTSVGVRLRGGTGTGDIFLALNRVRGCGYGFSFDSTGLSGGYVTAVHNDLRGNSTPILQGDLLGIYDFSERNFLFNLSQSSFITSAFTPTDISDMNLWIRSEYTNQTVDLAASPTFRDSSGNGRNMENTGTASAFRTNRLNGYPSVELSSGDGYTRTEGTAIVDTNFTLFIVAKTSGTNEQILTSANITDTVSAAILGSGGLNKMAYTDTTGHTVESDVLLRPRTEYCIYGWKRNGTSILFYQDGVLSGTGVIGLNPFRAARVNGVTGDLVEVILYKGVLSDSSRFLVENYLNDKYLLSDNIIGNQIVTGAQNVDSVKTRAIRITGGTPGSGNVLTSDANGVGTWQNPSSDLTADSSRASRIADTSKTALPLAGGTMTGAITSSLVSDTPFQNSYATTRGGIRTNTSAQSIFEVFNGATNVTGWLVEVNGDIVFQNATAISLKTTVLSAALTDGTPTDTELDSATGSTPAGKGSGWEVWIKDTDGTALMYRVVSDGTSWWTDPMTVAP